jgi:hypothetical protein
MKLQKLGHIMKDMLDMMELLKQLRKLDGVRTE